jgi:hypothetical protein
MIICKSHAFFSRRFLSSVSRCRTDNTMHNLGSHCFYSSAVQRNGDGRRWAYQNLPLRGAKNASPVFMTDVS